MKNFALGLCIGVGLFMSCRAKQTNTSDTEGALLNGQGQPWDFQALAFAKKSPCLQVPDGFQVPAGLPSGPDPKMTPGRLCHEGNVRRYKEKILFCDRDVSDGEKNRVAAAYKQAGLLNPSYNDSSKFKIDHFYPLCAGGANDEENLWPQHKSIGQFTDPIEPRVCSAMHMGVMKQDEAMRIITTVKTDITTAYDICIQLNKRIGL